MGDRKIQKSRPDPQYPIKYIVSFDKDFDTIKELTRIYDKQSLESLVHDRPDQPDRPNRPDRP